MKETTSFIAGGFHFLTLLNISQKIKLTVTKIGYKLWFVDCTHGLVIYSEYFIVSQDIYGLDFVVNFKTVNFV